MKAARHLVLALTIGWALAAAADVAVLPLSGRIVDQTATLNAGEIAKLEQTLKDFEDRKGSQVAVLIVPTTAPETIEQYSLRVAEQWKLGRKKTDDGALLIVAKNDRKLRIEVGYGLEGVLNDATAKRIIDEVITPKFRIGDFASGISGGVDRMLRVIDGESLPSPQPRPKSNVSVDDLGQMVPIIFILAVVIGGILRAVLGPFLGALATGGGVALIAWLIIGVLSISAIAGFIAFFVTLMGRGIGRGGSGGVFIPSGGGGGFSSGSSGGGFSGGGGSFGGGGASGSW